MTKTNSKNLVHMNVSLTLLCADIVAMALSPILAKNTLYLVKAFYADTFFPPNSMTYVNIHTLFFTILCPFVLTYFLAKGHYTRRAPWWGQVQNIFIACSIALIIDGFMRFALNMSVSRLVIGMSWIYLFFFILLTRQIAYHFLSRQKIWSIPTTVIGDIDTVTNLLFACHNDRYAGYKIKTVIILDEKERTFDLEGLPASYKNLEVLNNIDHYEDYILSYTDRFFIVSLETFQAQDRDVITNKLSKAGARYAVVPPISRINSYEMEPQYFFGYDLMLMHVKQSIMTPVQWTIKRAMDIFVSGLALLFLSPIFIAVSLFLKIEGQGGSIFYGGQRIGRDGQRFKCWKFRSMEPNSDHLLHDLLAKDPQAKADWDTYRKLKQPDPRITTRTAALIRKTSIDELPQLWNVFIGDMSLVGPRPILEDEVPLFGETINQYMRVRPGITGLWQVSGRNDTSFQRRVYWDGWYVRNWSLWGDIVILIKTLSVVFGRKGAF